ncbi:hypothetical protein Hanom_Chr04g00350101 [Helianthus anomalus]
MARRWTEADNIALVTSGVDRVDLGFPKDGPQTWSMTRTTFYERVGENIRGREHLGRFMHLRLKCSNFERCYITALNCEEGVAFEARTEHKANYIWSFDHVAARRVFRIQNEGFSRHDLRLRLFYLYV